MCYSRRLVLSHVNLPRFCSFSVRNQPSEICFVDQKELRGSLRESVTLEIVAHPLFGGKCLGALLIHSHHLAL